MCGVTVIGARGIQVVQARDDPLQGIPNVRVRLRFTAELYFLGHKSFRSV